MAPGKGGLGLYFHKSQGPEVALQVSHDPFSWVKSINKFQNALKPNTMRLNERLQNVLQVTNSFLNMHQIP